MKKKRIAAVMLAASLALGTAALTGCNLIGGTGDNGQEQTEGQKPRARQKSPLPRRTAARRTIAKWRFQTKRPPTP